jgi:hypothetical protein
LCPEILPNRSGISLLIAYKNFHTVIHKPSPPGFVFLTLPTAVSQVAFCLRQSGDPTMLIFDWFIAAELMQPVSKGDETY